MNFFQELKHAFIETDTFCLLDTCLFCTLSLLPAWSCDNAKKNENIVTTSRMRAGVYQKQRDRDTQRGRPIYRIQKCDRMSCHN